MARAPKGGTVGMNGAHYGGGQFLPNTTLDKLPTKDRRAATRKQEIDRYVWEVPPSPELRSIYQQTAGVFTNVINGRMVVTCSDVTLEYYKRTREEVQTLADRWNAGERWM